MADTTDVSDSMFEAEEATSIPRIIPTTTTTVTLVSVEPHCYEAIDPDMHVMSDTANMCSLEMAQQVVSDLAREKGVRVNVMLQALTTFAIESGTSLRNSDVSSFRFRYEGKNVVVTMLDVKRSLLVSGELHLRRVMRNYADYARRLMIAIPTIRPLGLRRRPDLVGYRYILFDFADGCRDPCLTPLEQSIYNSYKWDVLKNTTSLPESPSVAQDLE